MDTKLNCHCEHCGRAAETVEINAITVQNHTAHLCLACAHVLTLPKNETRFLQLVRKNTRKESNKEMQKVHQFISVLLAIGILFSMMIFVAGVSQGVDFASWLKETSKETEYVSFVEINDYK